MKNIILKIIFLIIAFTVAIFIFRQLNLGLQAHTLILVMLISYIIEMACILVNKSYNCDMQFRIGFKCMIMKIIILLLVELCALIDNYALSEVSNSNIHFKEFAIIGFVINEIVIIIDNVQSIGLKIPKVFKIIEDESKNGTLFKGSKTDENRKSEVSKSKNEVKKDGYKNK